MSETSDVLRPPLNKGERLRQAVRMAIAGVLGLLAVAATCKIACDDPEKTIEEAEIEFV